MWRNTMYPNAKKIQLNAQVKKSRTIIHYNEPLSTHKCNIFAHEVENKSELKQHMCIVHDHKGSQSPHTCEKCGEGFSLESELASHIMIIHS